MTNFLIYILQVTVLFTLCYLLYQWILSHLTFHNLNRYVLVALIPVSLTLPFLGQLFSLPFYTLEELPELLEIVSYEISSVGITDQGPTPTRKLHYSLVFGIVYCAGVFFGFFKLFLTILRLIRLHRNGIIRKEKDVVLVQTNVLEVFTCFNRIFIPKHLLKLNPLIIAHERIHIRLWHSLDSVLVEIYVLFFWFNPLSYSYRKSVKAVHEFQADRGVLQQHVKTSTYLRLVLTSFQVNRPHTIYSYFNHPIIKKRVEMMTKTKSKKRTVVNYLLLAPVLMGCLVAFTEPHTKIPILETENYEVLVGTIPPSLFPIRNASEDDISAFFGSSHKHPKLKKQVVHKGIDIKATTGTPVIATADGVILTAKHKGNWGNLIVITHEDGYQTRYAHLDGFNTERYKSVKRGEIIGYVGNTGLSTGPHLHYEVLKNGLHINPLSL